MEQKLENRIFTYSTFLHHKFGEKVFRVGLSTGIPCPHRILSGGCIFCNPESFTGSYQDADLSITDQLAHAIPMIRDNCGSVKLLAYFQDDTSTAGSPDILKAKFYEALTHPDVVGLVVSTRPDYVNPEIIELLKSLQKPVTLEIGLQTIHDSSLDFLCRGHDFHSVDEALDLCEHADLDIGVHLIMGIPGEGYQEMLKTINYVSSRRIISQVKFHNLVGYRNTALADLLTSGKIRSFPLSEYIPLLAELLPYLRGDIAISRLFTSNVRKNQISVDKFPGNKTQWMNSLRKIIYKKGIIQGSATSVCYDPDKYV